MTTSPRANGTQDRDGEPAGVRILYCHCAFANAVPAQVKRDVLAALSSSGLAFDAVADLCEMSARRDPALRRLAGSDHARIAACYPRAVEWLFHDAGAELRPGTEILNMREQNAVEVVRALLADRDGVGAP